MNVRKIRNYPDLNIDMEKLISDIRRSQGYAVDDLKIDESFEPRTVYIAESPFWMGSAPSEGIPEHETPQLEVSIPSYRIGVSLVTNAQYEVFVQETGTRVLPIMDWFGQRVRDGCEDLPVAGITLPEALAYCEWLNQKTGRDEKGDHYTIPNEAQWEKACRAGTMSRFPWGEENDPKRSNHGNTALASVYAYPAQNNYGLLDLVGNVRQWTVTLWGGSRVKPDPKFGYPWKNDRRPDPKASLQVLRVIRGCSFAEDAANLRCTIRNGQLPGDAGWTGAGIGFRVAMNLQP